jgi:hypothetical protein
MVENQVRLQHDRAGTAQSCDVYRLATGVRFTTGAGTFLRHVQTGYSGHPDSYPMGTGDSLNTGKPAEAWS